MSTNEYLQHFCGEIRKMPCRYHFLSGAIDIRLICQKSAERGGEVFTNTVTVTTYQLGKGKIDLW